MLIHGYKLREDLPIYFQRTVCESWEQEGKKGLKEPLLSFTCKRIFDLVYYKCEGQFISRELFVKVGSRKAKRVSRNHF
jgi:Golgi nucleoside diphosphatase